MGKGSGSTRSSSSSSPKGLTVSQNSNNVVSSITSTERTPNSSLTNEVSSLRNIPRYSNTEEWKAENVDKILQMAVDDVNRTVAENGLKRKYSAYPYAQLSWNENGERALRITDGGAPYSDTGRLLRGVLSKWEDSIMKELGVPKQAIWQDTTPTRAAGHVHYLYFRGWKGRR